MTQKNAISTVSYVSTVSAATRPLYTAGASIYNKSREPKRAYKKKPWTFLLQAFCRQSHKIEVKRGDLMQTEAERQERRKAYQREYYKERRKGERALNYVINIEASRRRREAQKQAKIKRRKGE